MRLLHCISLILLIAWWAPITGGQNPQGDVDLRKAAQDGDVKAVNDLIRLSADVNARDKKGRTALHWAAPARDNPLMIHILIANGADVNAVDNGGETALMIAASQSNQGIVEVLLEKGARVDAANKIGRTALMAAAYRANVEIIKILLANRADVKLKDRRGRTAFDLAKQGSRNYKDDVNRKRFAEALELLRTR
jgi:ankyrin repeat protein